MVWKDNDKDKRDIVYLINIVKDKSDINKDNNIDDTKDIFGTIDDNNIDNDTKDKSGTLKDNSIVVDDCDIIKLDLIDIYNVDNINIKIIEEL